MAINPTAQAWSSLYKLGVDDESQVVRRWMDSTGPSPRLRRSLAALRARLKRAAPDAVREPLGAVAVCLGEHRAGLALLEGATRNPGVAWKIEAQIQLGLVEPAASELESALRAYPLEPTLLRLAAVTRVHLGDRAGARRIFQTLLELQPIDALALALNGFLVDYSARDFDAALAALDRAVALRPDRGWPLALRSQARLALGDASSCMNDLNRAAQLEPAAWIYHLRSQGFNALGMAAAAVADLELAVKESPASPRFFQELGSLLFNSKRYAYAATAFTRAFQRSRERSEKIRILEQRAYAHWYGGSPEAALADLRLCLRLDPQSGEYLRLRAARVALSCGRERFASALLRSWTRSDKTEMKARASFLRGVIDFQHRRFSSAAHAFERSESLRRGTYISGEFPAMNYSTMARAMTYLEGGRAR